LWSLPIAEVPAVDLPIAGRYGEGHLEGALLKVLCLSLEISGLGINCHFEQNRFRILGLDDTACQQNA